MVRRGGESGVGDLSAGKALTGDANGDEKKETNDINNTTEEAEKGTDKSAANNNADVKTDKDDNDNTTNGNIAAVADEKVNDGGAVLNTNDTGDGNNNSVQSDDPNLV